jgi:hypothetical protein
MPHDRREAKRLPANGGGCYFAAVAFAALPQQGPFGQHGPSGQQDGLAACAGAEQQGPFGQHSPSGQQDAVATTVVAVDSVQHDCFIEVEATKQQGPSGQQSPSGQQPLSTLHDSADTLHGGATFFPWKWVTPTPVPTPTSPTRRTAETDELKLIFGSFERDLDSTTRIQRRRLIRGTSSAGRGCGHSAVDDSPVLAIVRPPPRSAWATSRRTAIQRLGRRCPPGQR